MGTKKYLDAFDNAFKANDSPGIARAVRNLELQAQKKDIITTWGAEQIAVRLGMFDPDQSTTTATRAYKAATKPKGKKGKPKKVSRVTVVKVLTPKVSTREAPKEYSDRDMILMFVGYTHDGSVPSFPSDKRPWEADKTFVGAAFRPNGKPELSRPDNFNSALYNDLCSEHGLVTRVNKVSA